MISTPRRRALRFAFSLRTLFVVVTLLACGLGYVMWQWRIVQSRKAILLELQQAVGPQRTHHVFSSRGAPTTGVQVALPLPYFRRQFGDETYSRITIPEFVDADLVNRIVGIFPEAEVEVEFATSDAWVYRSNK